MEILTTLPSYLKQVKFLPMFTIPLVSELSVQYHHPFLIIISKFILTAKVPSKIRRVVLKAADYF